LRRTGTRDISQVTFRTLSGHEFVAFGNHWPSRSGGYHTLSAGFRMTAGETLGYWHSRVLEEKADVPVIAFGDFNDDPADPSVTLHALALRERDDVIFGKIPYFYNLAWNYLRQDVTTVKGRKRTIYGTLYFDGDANLFDQIFVSKGFLVETSPVKAVEDSAKIVAPARMVSDSKNEGPIRFGLPKGNAAKYINENGFSDHFPVAVEVDVDDTIS
jgi:endonuclease/exonuclease/phosphatase family metal-dependent hydrolase